MPGIISNPETIKQLLENLKPVIGEDKVKKYWLVWNIENEQGKKSIEEALQLQYIKLFGSRGISEPGLAPIPEMEADGDYYIGDVSYNGFKVYPLKLRAAELPMHTAIFGRSGSGKSNTG